MKDYPSYEASVQAVKTFFSYSASQNEASIEEIYRAMGRDLSNVEKNKAWLRNRLTPLKHYGLVESLHSPQGTLIKVKLTQKGKEALGPKESTAPRLESSRSGISLETIAKDIKEFEKQNPSISVELNISIKKRSLH